MLKQSDQWVQTFRGKKKSEVNVGQSISVTDVKLQTCAECHLREQAGNHFHEAPKQTTHCPKDLHTSVCQPTDVG